MVSGRTREADYSHEAEFLVQLLRVADLRGQIVAMSAVFFRGYGRLALLRGHLKSHVGQRIQGA